MGSNANLYNNNLYMSIKHLATILCFFYIKCVTLPPPTYEEVTRIEPPDYEKVVASHILGTEIHEETCQSQTVLEIPDYLLLTTKEKITIFTVTLFFSFSFICLLLSIVSKIVFIILGVIFFAMGIIVGMTLK